MFCIVMAPQTPDHSAVARGPYLIEVATQQAARRFTHSLPRSLLIRIVGSAGVPRFASRARKALSRFVVISQPVPRKTAITYSADRDALIGELFRLPCLPIAPPRKNRTMADEEQQSSAQRGRISSTGR